MLVPNRHGYSNSYRYGFQGQEKDNEIKGEGNSLNYTFRMHDPRVGRFFAVDPLTKQYPHYTPYSFSGNKVVAHTELEGMEEIYYLNDLRRFKNYEAALVILEQSGLMSELKSQFSTNNTKADIYIVPSYSIGGSIGLTQTYEYDKSSRISKSEFAKEITENVYGMTGDEENKFSNFLTSNTLKDNQIVVLATFSISRLMDIHYEKGNRKTEYDYDLNWNNAAEIAKTIFHEIYGHAMDMKDGIDNVSTEKEHEKLFNKKTGEGSLGEHELVEGSPMYIANKRINEVRDRNKKAERDKILLSDNELKDRIIKKDNTNVKN